MISILRASQERLSNECLGAEKSVCRVAPVTVEHPTMPDHYDKRSEDNAEDSDEELFAELEAELENDEHAAVRERGLQELRKR